MEIYPSYDSYTPLFIRITNHIIHDINHYTINVRVIITYYHHINHHINHHFIKSLPIINHYTINVIFLGSNCQFTNHWSSYHPLKPQALPLKAGPCSSSASHLGERCGPGNGGLVYGDTFLTSFNNNDLESEMLNISYIISSN